ncbi:sulfate transporter-like [Plakobranchus ocellatus]|uniref:Sulfate transporter-like n=1 Tax=Plakobranchus ocellatus TaxID=259542 RepID=A0AAV4B726_9GAST|nr:sulfate transporter-like [Plakobranchus ocellatus]
MEPLAVMNTAEAVKMGQTEYKYPNLVEFENKFKDPEEKQPLSTTFRKCWAEKKANCSVKEYCKRLLPIVGTITGYNCKEDLPNDLIAGLTSGVMMIPQGMAFAALSTLPPIVGLYISFFASISYAVLGTGRQVSWGCIAVLSIMMGTILDKYDTSVLETKPLACFNDSSGVETNGTSFTGVDSFSPDPSDPVTSRRMEVASGVSLVAGLVIVTASRLGFSRVSNLLSNSLITGFTVGIAFHVGTSQLKEILGVSVPRQSGIGSIIKTWIEVIKKVPDTNVATLLTSVICILIIYVVKRFVNEKYKKKLRVPIPIDLFVAIIATLVTEYGKIHKDYDVRVVGDVPVGLPAPKIPDLSLSSSYIGDGLIIAVVAYTQTLALSKTFGLEHGYPVDPAQEMLASGVVNLVCGVFSGYIAAGSVSRSMVQNGAGGRTQLASVVAAVLVLLVILFAGPYFYYLPKCVLSAIIMVSLRSMMLKLLTIPEMWRRSPIDCIVWVFSCVATVVLNADLGILASVVLSLLLVVLRSMVNPVSEAGQIETGSASVELRSLRGYSAARSPQNARIVKIKTPVFFVNSEAFVNGIYEKTGVDPVKIKRSKKKMEKDGEEKAVAPETPNHSKDEPQGGSTSVDEGQNSAVRARKDLNGHCGNCVDEACSPVIILDASQMAFVDLMGVQALQFVITEMGTVGVEVFVAAVPESVIPLLKSTGFWKKHGDRLFLTVEAALAFVAKSNQVNVAF